ncbi:alpha/beta hydrolase [Stakelama saccharophila]|uniref:Alpha/beta hydrolase n=1 Tax=Stakelama saccharophila TaxID=3075605 RepID=A0ABZ0B5X6_9SPHN|nr:alpha/beta hydrolase [Stakelama sp. W311]WNO52792.1 alpha/beta hydrolase [Stakelama sp. W311]
MADAPLSSEIYPIWPGKQPGGPPLPDGQRKGTARPTLAVYRPQRPDGRAALVLPGGGYAFVSLTGEGANIGRALGAFGITSFVLDYRLPVDGWGDRADVPLQDAQRAMRLIRFNAGRFGIDPAKLGVIGFSAGGHLAASIVTAYDDAVYAPVGAADKLSARPAFGGLFYPVTTFRIVPPRSQSRRNLLGPNFTAAQIDRYSAIDRVTLRTPPLFLVHAMDDPIIPYWMSTRMLAAARAKAVPSELHLLERGGHGFGAGLSADNPGSLWPRLFALWTARHLKSKETQP